MSKEAWAPSTALPSSPPRGLVAEVIEPTLISVALTPGALTAGNDPEPDDRPELVDPAGAAVVVVPDASSLELPQPAASRHPTATSARPKRNRAAIDDPPGQS